MITVRLMGGLGNQMFQRAYGSALEKRGYDVQFDSSNLIPGTHREYGLDGFVVRTPLSSSISTNLVVERSLKFDESYLNPADSSTMVGYWQSSKYFTDIASDVRDGFRFFLKYKDFDTFGNGGDIGSAILASTNSVFVHVRRGDYLGLQNFHGLQTIDYYVDGLKAIDGPKDVFIFTDDPSWCRENLVPSIGGEVVYGNTRLYDLYLMTRCKNAIIANSSFSWWGAWLGSKKVVVSPKRWFVTNDVDGSDVVPDWWIKI